MKAIFSTLIVFLGCLPLHLSAQTIVPTQTDEIIIDNGAPAKADPGDRIRYKVTISNTGGTTATGLQFNAIPDPRTTLVPGSFRSSPLALPDAYASTGNVGINVPVANGLKANDFDDNLAGLTITAGTFATVQGGSIMLSADGSFMYTPPPGFTGSDTYTYTLNDANGVGGGVPATDLGVVTFTVSNLIYFIDNASVAATSDGRLTSPYKSLADFNAGSANPGNVVYLEHTGTNYTAGIVLAANEKLVGEGHTGGANLADVLGFSLAPFSKTLPNINGTRPVITNAAGNGIALGSNNSVRGVEVGAVTGAKISGSAFGTLIVGNTGTPDVILTGAGQALNLTNGTFDATSKFISVTTTSSAAQGINLNTVGGTVAMGSTTVSGNATQGILVTASTATIDFGNTAVSAGTNGVSLQNNSAGTRTFGTLSISGTSATAFLHANGGGTTTAGATTITNPGAGGLGIDIQGSTTAVTFAGTTVSQSLSTAAAVNLGGAATGNSGNVTFNSLQITTSNGPALIGTNNSGQINVTTATGSIIAGGGAAINISRAAGGNTPVNLNFSQVSTTTSPNNGIAFTNVSGTFSAPAGALGFIAGTAFLISGGTIVSTYGGSFSNNNALQVDIDNHDSGNITFQTGNITSTTQGIRVQNSNGGTIAFANPNISLTTGANIAVNLASNGGATINFSGGNTDISTTTGTGFNATGGGTVSVTGGSNTIVSTSAVALNVANTNIGSGDLIFLTINAGNNNASPDPASGIILNTTGNAGGLTVSGGTIQSTSRGVSVTSAVQINLTGMNLTNANTVDAAPCSATDNSGCNAALYFNTVTGVTLTSIAISGTTTQQGINLREVTDFTISNSTIANAGTGGQSEEGGIYAINLAGSGSITNTGITLPGGRGVVIYNTSKTLNLVVSGSTFDDTQTSAVGADLFEISTFGTSNTTLDIAGNNFTKYKTNGVQAIAEDNSVMSVDITGNTMDHVNNALGGGSIDLASNDAAALNFNIIGNPTLRAALTSNVNIFSFANSTIQGRINTNGINVAAGSGDGIRAIAQDASTSKLEINGNTITGVANDNGIEVVSRNGTGRMDAIISGNNITVGATANAFIRSAAGASASTFTNKTCAWVKNNVLTGGPGFAHHEGRVVNAHELILQGGGADMAANWNANANSPASPPAVMNPLVSGAGVISFAGVCNAPTHPLP